MEYNELMQSLGSNLGLEGLEPGSDGRYYLSIDDTTVAFIDVPDDDLLAIVARICELPTEDDGKICKLLLTAMAPGDTAEDFSFFINSEEECLYLRRTNVLSRLDTETLRQSLEKFVNALDEWRASINDFNAVIPAVNEALEQQAEEGRQFGLNPDGFIKI